MHLTENQLDNIVDVIRRASTLTLFSSLTDNPCVSSFVETFLHILDDKPDVTAVCYSQFLGNLVEQAPLEDSRADKTSKLNLWQSLLFRLLAESENVLTLAAEQGCAGDLPPGVLEMAGSDLEAVRLLGELPSDPLCALLDEAGYATLPQWDKMLVPGDEAATGFWKLKKTAESLIYLTNYIFQNGAGAFARARAFRWDGSIQEMVPAGCPDPIRLDDLWGYDRQKKELLRNTRKLLNGHRANNVLLYGERGTGKSSIVKAVFNEFSGEGLRLVEAAKEDLTDFPRIISLLRGRGLKFILFIDDLSFEEDDSNYKALKAILEGGIESRPENVVLYATSNRRNLVKEFFTDRFLPLDTDEVHTLDSHQEKLSLADRFGIRLSMLSTDQEEYLEVVDHLASREGLVIPQERLHRQALQWSEGRNPRTARQFIDWIKGEEGLAASL